MGYDIHWHEKPAELKAIDDELDALLRAPEPSDARSDRMGKLYDRRYDLQQELGEYFRVNIWGMGDLRWEMRAQGLLTSDPEPTDWPDYPEGAAEDSPEYLAYREARAKLIGFDHGTGGVPAYKFGSNDGWLVTPREIAVVLEKASPAPVTHPTGWVDDQGRPSDAEWPHFWKRWLAYLERAAQHGGCEVW